MLKALLCAALTLPLLAENPITRLACGACYKPKRDKGIWKTIAKDQPQAFLFMGDNVYADTEDMEEMKKSYSELTSLPDYAAFSKSVPIIPAWDDHDYGKNDAGRDEYPKRKEAQQIFFDAYQFPADHPARKSAGTYHSRIMGPDGKRLQIIVLDTRYFRSAPLSKKVFRHKTYLPQTDPTATMLGEAQWKWLEEELKKPAELRLSQLHPAHHGAPSLRKMGQLSQRTRKIPQASQIHQRRPHHPLQRRPTPCRSLPPQERGHSTTLRPLRAHLQRYDPRGQRKIQILPPSPRHLLQQKELRPHRNRLAATEAQSRPLHQNLHGRDREQNHSHILTSIKAQS